MPEDDELAHAWPAIRAELERAVPATVFQVWLDRIEPVELSGRTVVLAAPEPYSRHIAGRFARVLQTCAAAVLGADVEVDVVAGARRAEPSRRPGPAAAAAQPAPPAGPPDTELNPKYTFEQFVIGEGNRLAHAAALAVAEQPGQAYNPLFVYGPPGVGKTHLLHAIAAFVRAHGGGLSVRCTTADAFTSEFVGALHTGSVDRFKAAYRGADVLLIDDVQFLEAKARTEEEFFHTFNALQTVGAQLVLTSDRLPRDMAALEDRLRERFESGLVADVAAPDLDTRVTILRKRAQHDGLDRLDDRTLEAIAERVVDNVRALEGALIRVVAFHSLRGDGGPVTPDVAEHVLDRLYPAPRQRRANTVREIQEHTCEAFGLTLDDLVSSSRAARVSWPRQLAMYLARELTDATLPAIGRQFGGRDHATVLYAVRRASERIAADVSAHDAAQRLSESLGGDRSG
jgi:chromosomal replication initiator protein